MTSPQAGKGKCDLTRLIETRNKIEKIAPEKISALYARKRAISASDLLSLLHEIVIDVLDEIALTSSYCDDYLAVANKACYSIAKPAIEKLLTESGPVRLEQSVAGRVVGCIMHGLTEDEILRAYVYLWIFSRLNLITGTPLPEPVSLSRSLVSLVSNASCVNPLDLVSERLIVCVNGSRSIREWRPAFLELRNEIGDPRSLEKTLSTIPGTAIALALRALDASDSIDYKRRAVESLIDSYASKYENELVRKSIVGTAIVLLESAADAELLRNGATPASRDSAIRALVEVFG